MTSPRSIRRSIAVATLLAGVAGLAVPANARSALDGYEAERASITRSIEQLRERRAETADDARAAIERATKRLQHIPGPGIAANPERFRHLRRALLRQVREAEQRTTRAGRLVERRVGELQARRRSVDAWIATWGIFRECPVRGWHSIADNFGITVRLPGVPVHRHMGNDILASAGTPIVAPFDGYASSSTSELGGLEVRVTGSRGYVYNAHLSAVGTLGHVRAGTIVGYVGATGDATTAHDHLEWHPYGGGAVDPNPYLTVSCG